MLLLPLLAFADDPQMGTTGLQRDVVFTDYSPLSQNTELVRRLMTPLSAVRMRRAIAQSELAVREQSIDLAHEKFVLYVPSRAPPHGYALLVFVPPWPDARVPWGWASKLEQHGVIFVSAANSGNDASILDRREPLALLAAQNVMRRYRIDPERVYVGGFSGGSRVALRIALGYPDVFHGALLNAGSDPIGDAEAPLPPAELFRTFRSSTRLVYLTGQQDTPNLDKDGGSRLSMRNWCVFNVDTQEMPRVGHEVADSVVLNRALRTLFRDPRPDPDKLAECRARIEEKLSAELRHVEDLLADGKSDDALKLLERIDTHYGGLAAPRSIALAEQIEALTPSPPTT
jgi:pimeloyl-ACP methyl ester carboxylesterase